MFSESSPPLPWDENHAYTRDTIELYYQVCTKCIVTVLIKVLMLYDVYDKCRSFVLLYVGYPVEIR